MQGPYTTLLNACERFIDKTDILASNITIANSLDGLPNSIFSRLYSGTNSPLPAYLNHAVSVKDSSGMVIACGRLETLFAVDVAYKGKGVLNQYSQFLHPGVSDPSDLELLQYNIVDSAGICSSEARIFNPWMAPKMQQGDGRSLDQFPVGNLPNHGVEFFSILPEVPLIGNATVIGHTVSLQFWEY